MTTSTRTWLLVCTVSVLLPPARLQGGSKSRDTDWFRDAGYGVFMHFLPSDAGGLALTDKFDVDALAGQLEAVGAKYFVITLGQNSGYFISPNSGYDQLTGYAPGERCARRDLPLDLYQALRPKGIRLMLYLPCQTPNQDARAQKAFGLAQGAQDQPIDVAFAGKWAQVIQEWSDRYGDMVAGWWFDGGYEHIHFNEAIAKLYADAVKHGNPHAIVTFNPGVRVVRHTKAEDYTAGELNDPFDVVPANRWLEGSQWHALTFLGSNWSQRDTRHPAGKWVEWVKKVVDHEGVVTLDMGPNWNPVAGPIGSLAQAQLDQVKAIREGLAADSASASLNRYRADLTAFRKEYGGARDLPDVPFFQFGMGLRTKYLFRNGALLNARTGTEVQRWPVKQAVIVPPDYRVRLVTSDGRAVEIQENEEGVWIEQDGVRRALEGTRKAVRLPDFRGRRYSTVLRVLHHEILINVTDAGPVPNFYVYRKPWYRDGAMMAMCLKTTGNLDLVRDWILDLTEPYDRNNAGETEADNPGQVLYLISLVSDKKHPLVTKALEELHKLEVRGQDGRFIKGRSDFSEHPVYQTKWTKYGLRALGLDDPYVIPRLADSYSSLFWMDWRDVHVRGTEAVDRDHYPYLGWATDHFLDKQLSPISNRDYPLTWETDASQADYRGMGIVDPAFVSQKIAAPHTWHAAEVFLYLLDAKAPNGPARESGGTVHGVNR